MSALLAGAFFGVSFFRTLLFLAIAFLWAFALYDLAKSRSRGWVKAAWLAAIIFLPVLGAFAYLVSRPQFMTEPAGFDDPSFQGHEREEIAVEMTHRAGA
jgi:hypothetical protein